MPHIAAFISSDFLRTLRHRCFQIRSKVVGDFPTIEVFLHTRDPYSFVLLHCLPRFIARYKVNIQIKWLYALQEDMIPEPILLQQYAYQDGAYLSELYEVPYPNKEQQYFNRGSEQFHLDWTCALQSMASDPDAAAQDNITACCNMLSDLHLGKPAPDMLITDTEQALKHLNLNQSRQMKLGHYSPATLYFCGDWYWGVDRLEHLENRLIKFGFNRHLAHTHTVIFNKTWKTPEKLAGSKKICKVNSEVKIEPIVLYWSARSPYSYLALIRCLQISSNYNVPLDIRPVLPMMMRNMQVPKAKKMYIFHDTKREANKYGIDYGKVADPLGLAVERCYALLDYAKQQGKYLPFLTSFAKGVNSQGIRAETDEGLREIVEDCGLDWLSAKVHLHEESWREITSRNQEEMKRLGLWGVPCVLYKGQVMWGQDRLGRLESLLKSNLKHSR